MKQAFLLQFIAYITHWYQLYGRHDLPWRQTTHPYPILVSELMLQQTQVSRVIPKFNYFLQAYPTVDVLADASLAEVLVAWQGLGYNRRARYLWQLARQLVNSSGSHFPKLYTDLEKLPGIGPYTAAAVGAFAYNQPTVVLETNIRAVLLYHFFPCQDRVSDSQLLPLLESCLPLVEPRTWYAALMDYGAYLKSKLPNPSRKSRHHARQSKFHGSIRQVRGEIIRTLTRQPKNQGSHEEIKRQIEGNLEYFELALEQLCSENLVSRMGQILKLGEVE